MIFNFPPTVQNQSDVPEVWQTLYESKDGGFALKQDPLTKTIAETIAGTSRALSAAREELKGVRAKIPDLSPLQEFGESVPDIVEGIKSRLADAGKKSGKGEEELQALRASMTASHTAELKKRDEAYEKLQKQLYAEMVTSKVVAAAAELGADPDLLLPFVTRQIAVIPDGDNFKINVVDQNNQPRFSSEAPFGEMGVVELIKTMKKDAKFGQLFKSEASSGSGTNPKPQPKASPAGGAMSPQQKIVAGLADRQRM